MKKIQSNQAGFTLIELVMVIVILGILAATALPRFVDLSGDAYSAASQGYAGALNSANSVNYAGCAAKGFPTTAVANVCAILTKCSQVGALVNPNINFAAALDSPTTKGKLYLITANDTALTKNSTSSCSAVYGDGSAAGLPFTFSATGT